MIRHVGAVGRGLAESTSTLSMMSDGVGNAATHFALGQTGNPAFAVKSWDDAVRAARTSAGLPEELLDGATRGSFIQAKGTTGPEGVFYGQLRVVNEPREVVHPGGFLRKSTTETVYDEKILIKKLTAPKPPGPIERVMTRLKSFKSDAKELEKQAHEIGAEKQNYLVQAENFGANAAERVDQAYKLLVAGDRIAMRTAVSEAVSATMTARKWTARAEKLSEKEAMLRGKVDDFNAGLEELDADVKFLEADLKSATIENRIMKNASALGEGADSLADDLAAARAELDQLTGSTRALNEQIENGDVASAILNPIKSAAAKSEREAATDAVMAQLDARFAQEQAAGQTVTTATGQTLGAASAQTADDIAASVLGKTQALG